MADAIEWENDVWVRKEDKEKWEKYKKKMKKLLKNIHSKYFIKHYSL
jgi:hypothetical protein